MISYDFSVIVQGPIIGHPGDDYDKQKTLHCLQSIRKVLPDAEIIISTWIGSDVSHLFYDKLVFNNDPGAISYNDNSLKTVFNNTNRQIVSTYNGLKQASRKYAIKMRGDFILENHSFFTFWDRFPNTNKYNFFKHRIIVPTYVSRDPEKTAILYHISDLFQIGFTTDLLDLWDIPLQPEPQTTRAFPYNTGFINNPYKDNEWNMRFSPEQYIWYAFAKKKGLDLDLDYYYHIPPRIISKSIVSIIDNFIIASPQQLGILLPEHIRLKFNEKYLFTHEKWLQLYEAFSVKKSNYQIKRYILIIIARSAKNILKNIKRLFKRKFLKHFSSPAPAI